MTEKKKLKFVIQCPNPECLNKDIDEIHHVEMIPSYANLQLEDDGSLTIRICDAEIYYDGAGGGKLECQKCGTDWEIPDNANPNWE